MIGSGILKGLGVTLKHFIESYVEDFKYYTKKPAGSILEYRMDPHTEGIYTMQYPEEQPVIPEAFRFLPFLVTDYEGPEFDKRAEADRCTSCGICAKACPPQCIWIVRTTDPETGRPIPQPKEFYIDMDICMNCGYCAEFCPFDAIIMDHEFALADYAREGETNHVHDLDKLMKPASYYKEIRPVQYTQKEQERIAEEEEKKRKAEEKARKQAAKKVAAAKDGGPNNGEDKPAAKGKRSPEEIKAQREAMLAKKKSKPEAGSESKTEARAKEDESGEQAPPAKHKRTPEEVQAQREAMMAKRRAKQEGKEE
jgi:NADH-quinone oxidoreductase subunit I